MKKLLLSGILLALIGPLAAAQQSQILGFKVLGQTPDAVRFEVHYFYANDQGNAFVGLQAAPLLRGRPQGYWGFQITPVQAGDHTVQIRVQLTSRAPRESQSDSMEFGLYASQKSEFAKKDFPFSKTWKNSHTDAAPAVVAPPLTTPIPPAMASVPKFFPLGSTPRPFPFPADPRAVLKSSLHLFFKALLPFIIQMVFVLLVIIIFLVTLPLLKTDAPILKPGEFLPGGIGRRFVALMVDHLFFFIPYILILAGLYMGLLKMGHLAWMSYAVKINSGVALLLWWLYAAGFESSRYQATPGKRMVGLMVIDEYGRRLSLWRATGRTFSKYLSGLGFGIGYLMAAFTDRNQALHDMIAHCLVVRKGESVLGRTVAIIAGVLFLFLVSLGLGIRYWLFPKLLHRAQSSLSGRMLGAHPIGPLPERIDLHPSVPVRISESDYMTFLNATAPQVSGGIPAGPVLLQKDHFWQDATAPHFWIKVQAADFPNHETACRVAVQHVWNRSHTDVYDSNHIFEKNNVQPLQLSGPMGSSPYLSGLRDVYLMKGTQESDLQSAEGELVFHLPVDVQVLEWTAADIGKEQSVGGVKIKLVSMKDSSVSFTSGGDPALRVKVAAQNAGGLPLQSYFTMSSMGTPVQTTTCQFYGIVQKFQVYIAPKILERRYPFVLSLVH